MKNVIFNDDVKNSMLKGVQLISDAVGTTYGPNGRNVIIKTLGGIHITKDGMTVATNMVSDDPYEQMAMDVVTELSQKTAKDVGDGTTTCVLLTKAIVDAYKDVKDNPIGVQRMLQDQTKKVVAWLENKKKPVENFEDLVPVATVAANNDPKIGALIAEAYTNVGKYGIVNIEESQLCEDSCELHEGLQLDSGFASPFFINTQNNTCELENVLVYITQESIMKNADILPIAEKALQQQKSLLIIATNMETFIQEAFLKNAREHILESCFVKMPHHGIYKDMFIDDLKRLLGSTMTCDKVIVSKSATTFIGCHTDCDNTKHIEEIEYKLKNPELSETEQRIYSKRLANFKGGICTIKVGGYSQTEIKEKKDRIEDAVCATKAALLHGTLPGGGVSLYRASQELDLDDTFKKALQVPLITLAKNSTVSINAIKDSDFETTIDFKKEKVGNAYKMGVIEPFQVTKVSLENAVTAASLILTSGCSIIKI